MVRDTRESGVPGIQSTNSTSYNDAWGIKYSRVLVGSALPGVLEWPGGPGAGGIKRYKIG